MEKIALYADPAHIAEIADDKKLHLGVKSLASIVEAFETAPVTKDGILYDAIENNCVVLLRNMADPLDIPVDERLIAFITRNLLDGKSKHVFDAMLDSPALSKVMAGGKRFLKHLSNEDLLAKVIKLYV